MKSRSDWPAFCALCLDTIAGVPRQQPLGRDSAMVNVCATCDSAHAVEKRGPGRGYPVSEDRRVSLKNVRAAAGRVLEGHNIDVRDASSIGKRTTGYLLVRVKRHDAMGKARDRNEAAATFAHKPWASEARFIGSVGNFVLFERPDPLVAKESRGRSENPLVWLEPYRVQP